MGSRIFANRCLKALAVGILPLAAGCFTAADSVSGKGLTAGRCHVPDDGDVLSDQVLQLVNLERADHELPPVVMNERLSKIADDYACRMIELNFFGHNDPETDFSPGDRALAGEYLFFAIGENLAAGQQTAAEVMDSWMNSDGHRANILDERWKEVGISVRMGGLYSVYWVQEFGDPAERSDFEVAEKSVEPAAVEALEEEFFEDSDAESDEAPMAEPALDD